MSIALMTDEWSGYFSLGDHFASHESVSHKADEYVRGGVHTNTVEGYYSIFKRGMKGVYQHCDERHLHRYRVRLSLFEPGQAWD
jgi:ISXO2 transposase-like protein